MQKEIILKIFNLIIFLAILTISIIIFLILFFTIKSFKIKIPIYRPLLIIFILFIIK